MNLPPFVQPTSATHRSPVDNHGAWLWLVFLLLTPLPASTRSYSYGARDFANLRQIGQSLILYANDHDECLPPARDVWDVARFLAVYPGLDDARVWQSAFDPAVADTCRIEQPVLLSRRTPDALPLLTPEFRRLKLSYAVALGPLKLSYASTTPIAWTRGLQPDGTWAAHSPNGTRGGHIFFLGGNVVFYRNLTDDGGQLVARDGSKTSNILDALPPGTRISEYTPTPAEIATWSKQRRSASSISRSSTDFDQPITYILAAIWVPFLGISLYRTRKQRPGAIRVLLWPVLLSILATIAIPTVASVY